MKDPIIITGIPRSGKTMIAGILNICGVFAGDVDKRYENHGFQEQLLAPYLTINGIDPEGQSKFIDTKKTTMYQGWKDDVEKLITKQGYKDGKWLLKSSQISLMWPLWEYAFPKSKYVIVRRRTGDIVQSCMKTSYMTGHKNEEGWIQMCREYDARFVEMINAGLDCKVIWPHRMAYGDYEQIYELLDWLGLEWKSEILSWVDPKFHKARKMK